MQSLWEKQEIRGQIVAEGSLLVVVGKQLCRTSVCSVDPASSEQA